MSMLESSALQQGIRHQTSASSLDAPHRVSDYSKQNKKAEFTVLGVVVRRCLGQAVRPQSAWNKTPAPTLEKSWDATTEQGRVGGSNR